MEWLSWFTEPLSYGFMVRGLLAAVMVGIICPIIGSYIILLGMSFFGDALAHTILPGVVLAFLFDWPLVIGALIFGILTPVIVGLLTQGGEVREDTAIGIVFAGSFALGVAMISTLDSYAVDLTHILFGDVLGVGRTDLIATAALGSLVLLTVAAFYKEFLVLAFDPTLAVVLRLPAGFLRYLLLILIGVTVVVSLQTVGVALVLAMLITPAAAAQLLTHRLPTMMAVAAFIGVLANVVGLYLSFYLNIASGPAMVLTATTIFLLVFIFAPERGVLWRRLARRSAEVAPAPAA
jgi:manganese/iron transport system permease protein